MGFRVTPTSVFRRFSRLVAGLSLLLAGSLGLVEQNAAGGALPSAGEPSTNAVLTAVPAARAANNLAVITIHGMINAVTAQSFERRLKAAADGGADGVVVELDTPGGEVGAVLEICGAIKRSPIPNTIAWINPRAYSGGVFVALACREIVVAPSAVMGDAAPVAGDPLGLGIIQGLKPTERQKMLAPLLTELTDSAHQRGYDELLVQAFVTLGVELWFVEHIQTGQRLFVTESEYRTIFGTEPPRGAPHIPSGATAARSNSISPSPSADHTDAEPRKFVPAFADGAGDMQKLISDNLETSSQRPVLTEASRGQWRLIHYATDGNALLTLSETDMKLYGFAEHTIRNDAELKSFTGAQNLRRLDPTWSEEMVDFMTQGLSGLVVRGVLIVIFLMAMFIEMSMPGVGLPGAVALLALAGLIVPPLLIGASAWWALVAILAGVLLLAVEVFILPGFGVPGFIGLLLLIGGLVATFASPGQLFPGVGKGNGDLMWAGTTVLLAIFGAGVGAYFFSRYTHRFPIAGKLVLAGGGSSSSEREGMLSAMAPSAPSEAPVKVGEVGIASTPLRPSGTAEFGEHLVDVVSDFGFVEPGAEVRVTSVSKYRIGVEAVRNGRQHA